MLQNYYIFLYKQIWKGTYSIIPCALFDFCVSGK